MEGIRCSAMSKKNELISRMAIVDSLQQKEM